MAGSFFSSNYYIQQLFTFKIAKCKSLAGGKVANENIPDRLRKALIIYIMVAINIVFDVFIFSRI